MDQKLIARVQYPCLRECNVPGLQPCDRRIIRGRLTLLVYLVRHGEAKSNEENPSRPLSDNGERDITAMAELMAYRVRMFPGRIYHSPKLRAVQTAAIIGEKLQHAPELVESEGLSPTDDPAVWAERLESEDMDIMLVGHLPHITRLCSHLLTFESGREIVEFKPGTVVCLQKTVAWRIKWIMSPDILKRI
jgi:phosphohistidine phosphatase